MRFENHGGRGGDGGDGSDTGSGNAALRLAPTDKEMRAAFKPTASLEAVTPLLDCTIPPELYGQYAQAGADAKAAGSSDQSSSDTTANTGTTPDGKTLLQGYVSKTVAEVDDSAPTSAENQIAPPNGQTPGAEIGSGIIDGTKSALTEMGHTAATLAKTAYDVASVPHNMIDFAINSVTDPAKATADAANTGAEIGKALITGKKMLDATGAAFKTAGKYIDAINATGDYTKPIRDLTNAGESAYNYVGNLSTHDKASLAANLAVKVGVTAITGAITGPAKAAEAAGESMEGISTAADASTLSAQGEVAASTDATMSDTGGAFDNASDAQRTSKLVDGGGLSAHEGINGAHTLEKHVGWTGEQLMERALTLYKGASSFTDRATAESACSEAIDANQGKIAEFMKSATDESLILKQNCNFETGQLVPKRTLIPETVKGVKVVLRQSTDLPNGWYVHTAFPIREVQP